MSQNHMTQPIIFHRSGSVTDWLCPRKRYWNYEHEGRGITPPETQLELYLGTLIHDGVAAMVHDVANEQCALAEGLLRGFHRAVWPRICADYPEVVMCEKEMTYPYTIDGQELLFLSKPDLVRRDKEGNLWVFEW